MFYDAQSHQSPERRPIMLTTQLHQLFARASLPNVLGLVVTLGPHFFCSHAAATPLNTARNTQQSSLSRRDHEPDHQVTTQIWIPIVALGIVIAFGSLALRYKDKVALWITRRQRSETGASLDAARELTAEQLAGTINGNTTSGNTDNAPRTRRNRRPRRTPSQMSTTSLPAYAKEPGEQELVIFRGPEDMEDAGMPPATVVMDSLSEDGEETLHSRNNSQISQYPGIPTSPADEPLLQHDESSADLFLQLSQPPGTDMPRRSSRMLDNPEDISAVRGDAPAYDDQAPPYFEAVDVPLEGSHDPRETSATTPTTPPLPEPGAQRRSGFRTLLHSLPNRLSMHGSSHAHTASHSRTESTSFAPSENSHGRETSQSRASHRPSPSGSSSVFSLSPFRTLSRQKSLKNVNLNSPSLISLDSISSPLAHTLTRTEFTYPKSGPTPEQLKLISSRESFARFGVPYGADAIAFAASTSRHDLSLPPPDFDLSSTIDNHTLPESVAGPSRLRTMSNAADIGRDAGAGVSVSSSVSGRTTTQPDSANVLPLGESAATEVVPHAIPPSPLSSRDANLVYQFALVPSDVALPASPEISHTPSPNQSPEIEAVMGGLLEPSFRAPSTFDNRVESRASSAASFATASESILPPLDQGGSSYDEDDVNTPNTPKMGTQHVLERTDATIKPSTSFV